MSGLHQSVDETRQPEPLGVTGLLGLHDAVESFLQVTAEQFSIALPPFVPFLEYFKLIRNGAGVKLRRQREMEDLNSLRVNFKHRGTLSGTTATADACEDVRRFLEENTSIDYWQFERFKRLTPRIVYFMDGGQERRAPQSYAPTANDFGFCHEFVVTAAIRVAEHQT